MKKALLFLVCCLGMVVGRAQTTWCPAGAEWNYHWLSMTDEGYSNYIYVGDTVYYNRACQKIETINNREYHGPYPPYSYDTMAGAPLYTYATGDTVYFYYEMFSKWLPVYYFNAQVGDTLTIPNIAMHTSSDSSVNVLVDSVGTMLVGASTSRYYSFHVLDSVSWCLFPDRAIERLGILNSNITPFWHCFNVNYRYEFCSYKDNAVSLYPADAVCRFIINDVAEVDDRKTFSLSPNPATDQLNITIDESLVGAQLNIYNTTGNLVQTLLLATGNAQLSTVSMPAGIYIAEVKTKEASVKKRWVKM